MLKKILVPVDGSLFSEHALPAAVATAQRAGAELHIVQVHEPVFVASGPEALPVADPEMDRALRTDEENYLRGLVARCTDRGAQATASLLDGPVAVAISSYAMEVDVDCIVMTTHGRGGISRLWVGSVADALVRRSCVPIILVRPRGEEVDWERTSRPDHILVPLDGSRISERILPAAIDWGRVTGARFTLLRVVLPLPFVGPPGMPPVFMTESINQAVDEAGRYLEGLAGEMRDRHLEVQTAVIIHATPAVAILDYAATHAADAIAMATHGRGGWSRIALGSVADKVMRGTSMPVLLLAPHADDGTRLRREHEQEVPCTT